MMSLKLAGTQTGFQYVGNQRPKYVKVPYTLIELEQWKTTVGKYKENPDKVAKSVDRAKETHKTLVGLI
ncbi:hypothetical protein Nmel_003745 [Mimus melanotis]